MLGPLKIEINSYDPFHLTIKQLMFSHECDEIIANNTHKLDLWKGPKAKHHEKLPWTDVRIMQKYVSS